MYEILFEVCSNKNYIEQELYIFQIQIVRAEQLSLCEILLLSYPGPLNFIN